MNIFMILAVLLMFCLIILVHEFGHFAAAKLLGVRVHEFALGMGPILWKKRKGDTQYSLRALPIGGFCRLEGEDGEDENPGPDSFTSKPWWAKVVILAAGGIMNVLLCLVILTVVFWHAGVYSTTLEAVDPALPAGLSGIMAGDVVTSVDGENYQRWEDIINAIGNSEGKTLEIGVSRNGEDMVFSCTPVKSGDGRWIVGIRCKMVPSLVAGVKNAFSASVNMIKDMGRFFARLLGGRASPDELVGVVGIVSIMGQQARMGISNLLFMLGTISLNIGFVNLLPVPALDGSRIFFVLVRKVSGGRLSEKAEGYVHGIGMVLLMALMVFLVFKDVNRFIL